MTKINVKISPREVVGKKVKELRKEGQVPVSLYGPKYESRNFAVNAREMGKVFADAGYSNIIDAAIDGEDAERLLIKEMQVNPVTDEILHVSFYVIDRKTAITANVPVVIIGESPVVDTGEGFVVPSLDAITIRCLPDQLMSEIQVDVSGLAEIGASITVSDIKLPEGVELDSSMDPTTAVAYVSGLQKIEEAPAVELDEEGNPIVAEGAEGAEATEGEESEKSEE